MELRLEGPSYTSDTLERYNQRGYERNELFFVIGADAFAERARRELLATGEKVRKREVNTSSQLTSQEEHIIRLARDGRSNREIAAELFISTRTVEWHFFGGLTFGEISTRSMPAS